MSKSPGYLQQARTAGEAVATSANTSTRPRRMLTGRQQRFLAQVQRWRLPLMAAPMFLVSGPELVTACARAGVVGSFPAANARSIEQLDDWLAQTVRGIAGTDIPFALNLIVHSTYDRFEREMELVRRYQPQIVSTALGSPRRVLADVHAYGGVVMADVVNPGLARKAAEAGVDVLILVAQGAGGHTGQYNPFAFVAEVREFWDGPLGLAGAITSGRDIRAAQLLGADFVVAGTRFIAARESLAAPAYRDLLVQSRLQDLVLTSAVSGVEANWLKPTLDAAGFTPEQLRESKRIDFSGDIAAGKKAWKDVWSAGHGLGGIRSIDSVAGIVAALRDDLAETLREECESALALRDRLAAQP
jgi:nitronate monooxygenase